MWPFKKKPDPQWLIELREKARKYADATNESEKVKEAEAKVAAMQKEMAEGEF